MEESLKFTSSHDCENLSFSEFTTIASEDTVCPSSDTSNRNESSEGSSTSRNAARERSRVRSLRAAFHSLQMSLPSVPPNTKLSKLDVLVLAANYISHLTGILQNEAETSDYENCQYSNANIEGALTTEKSECVGGKMSTRKNRNNYLHPVKKWPIRSRLYAGIENANINATSKAFKKI